MGDATLRDGLRELLQGGSAHLDFDSAVEGLAFDDLGTKPGAMPHSPWQLVEHMRIAQWDILRFTIDAQHRSPEFPDGYWPVGHAPAEPSAWDRTLRGFRDDLRAMLDLVADPKTDLLAPLPHDPAKTVFREALVLADHNAYHLGQLVAVRRALGLWEDRG